jgi:hypothetical protein
VVVSEAVLRIALIDEAQRGRGDERDEDGVLDGVINDRILVVNRVQMIEQSFMECSRTAGICEKHNDKDAKRQVGSDGSQHIPPPILDAPCFVLAHKLQQHITLI